jgi:hypothetical protein
VVSAKLSALRWQPFVLHADDLTDAQSALISV